MSVDGTRDVLENCLKDKVDKIIYHKENSGKGAAVRTGFLEASGDVIIVQDADMEYDPNEYPTIVKPIFDNEAKVVYGSRFLKNKAKGYISNRIANKVLTALSNVFTKQGITDMETCYKAFNKDVIAAIELEEERFGFDPEVTAKVSKLGVKIKEVPISYNPRSKEDGKKIGIKDGIRSLYCIFKYGVNM
jgi:glycosyltransferase involved in cell wall biosynthesis